MSYYPYGCLCGARWNGTRTTHCQTCHQTFDNPTTFDTHRAGSHTNGKRHCQPPDTQGLVDAGRAYPCWAQPTTRK